MGIGIKCIDKIAVALINMTAAGDVGGKTNIPNRDKENTKGEPYHLTGEKKKTSLPGRGPKLWRDDLTVRTGFQIRFGGGEGGGGGKDGGDPNLKGGYGKPCVA